MFPKSSVELGRFHWKSVTTNDPPLDGHHLFPSWLLQSQVFTPTETNCLSDCNHCMKTTLCCEVQCQRLLWQSHKTPSGIATECQIWSSTLSESTDPSWAAPPLLWHHFSLWVLHGTMLWQGALLFSPLCCRLENLGSLSPHPNALRPLSPTPEVRGFTNRKYISDPHMLSAKLASTWSVSALLSLLTSLIQLCHHKLCLN